MNENRHHYIDTLRVIGMFFVVLLHSSAERLRIDIGTQGWHIDNALTSLATIAVPLFFMISGAVILGSKSTEDYRYVLKKRLPKMLVPLLVWSIVSLAIDFALGAEPETILNKAKLFFSEPVTIHLWFMYTLIPLYLFSPILAEAAKNRRTLKYAAVLFFVISLLGSLKSVLPAAYAFIPDIAFLRNAAFGSYIYYFLLGYLLHTSAKRFDTRLLAGITVVTWVVISAGTYWKSAGGQYSEIFKSYTGIFCLILSCSVFLLLKNLFNKPYFIVSVLAPLSFGVYLSHNLLIRILNRMLPILGITVSMKYVVVCFIITSVVCCVTIWVLSKIKIVSYLFCGIDKGQNLSGGGFLRPSQKG